MRSHAGFAAKLAFGLIGLQACAIAPVYQSTSNQAQAAIYFTSPYRQGEFMVVNRLALLVYSADNQCNMTLQGRIPVSDKAMSGKPTYVPANERLYLRVWQRASDVLTQTSGSRTNNLSLVPIAGGRYEIRHVDNPAMIRVEVHKLEGNAAVSAVETGSWADCE